MSNELQVVKSDVPMPNVAHMLQAVIEKGVTTENVSALEKLCDLYERMEKREAEKQFISAFVRMQAEMKSVQATKAVPNKQGGVKYRIAPYEEIDDQARPIYQKHGFAVSFSEGESAPDKVTEVMTLSHIGGHSRTNFYTVRPGAGPPDSTESQKDVSGHSYARRGALCDGLHIVINHAEVDDARLQGAPVSAQQAKSLRDRVLALAIDVDGFLRYGGAKTFETIPVGNYAMLDASLKKKEKVS
jgi:hypothetical protein